ncbi:hypothetical protein DUI87_09607 [Hirundo rustica rustica]|uniref:Uncharacterized protein n=1 Tax=Hirundo rustica rustica TaxID=333673 RepID=A0A3M0KUQ9_HIRRU|nr:hypothetical protein DUI87_09607 [Hirundo rustica rustica]
MDSIPGKIWQCQGRVSPGVFEFTIIDLGSQSADSDCESGLRQNSWVVPSAFAIKAESSPRSCKSRGFDVGKDIAGLGLFSTLDVIAQGKKMERRE